MFIRVLAVNALERKESEFESFVYSFIPLFLPGSFALCGYLFLLYLKFLCISVSI